MLRTFISQAKIASFYKNKHAWKVIIPLLFGGAAVTYLSLSNLKKKEQNSDTALHAVDNVEDLDTAKVDFCGMNALHHAVTKGCPKVLSELVTDGAIVDQPVDNSPWNYTPLFLAVMHQKPEAVKKLLAAGADPNRYDAFGGNTSLTMAVRKNNHEIAQLLLDAGANPHFKAISDDWSPLMWAEKEGKTAMIELLQRPKSREN